jgi:nitrate/nitrite transporter NarK
MIATALLIAGPAYIFFGWLSDRIGRKPVILGGYTLGIIAAFPLFHLLTEAANPALARAQAAAPVVVLADPAACSFQFDPLGRTAFDRRSCDIAKAYLTRNGIAYANRPLPEGATATIRIGEHELAAPEPAGVGDDERKAAITAFHEQVRAALDAAGYPSSADPSEINTPLVVAIVAFLVMLSAMTYAPLAAMLVELFPARIRYTSLSVPYHIGAGWIGGFLPTTAFAIVAATGDIYAGLWYPVIAAGVSLIVGLIALPETYKRTIQH